MATRQTKNIDVNQTISDSNEVSTEKTNIPKKKVFKATDGIPCKSITSGGLYMEGLKSHILYEWSDIGDITEIEYQDLLASLRSNSNYLMKPLFVVEDEDFVSQNPKLEDIYKVMYSFTELRDVITNLNPSDMKATILSLPRGAQESLKHTASQLVSNGELDSVKKINILDEIFNTEFKLMAGL